MDVCRTLKRKYLYASLYLSKLLEPENVIRDGGVMEITRDGLLSLARLMEKLAKPVVVVVLNIQKHSPGGVSTSLSVRHILLIRRKGRNVCLWS